MDWWKICSGKTVFLYLVDDFYHQPVVASNYPVEIQPNSYPNMKDLIKVQFLQKLSIPILHASAVVMGKSASLLSKLNEWAVLEITKIQHTGPTMTDLHLLNQSISKLPGMSITVCSSPSMPPQLAVRFTSVDDYIMQVTDAFFHEYDADGKYCDLCQVYDRDGNVRWTTEIGVTEMDQARGTTILEMISHQRRLSDALREAQDNVQRVNMATKRLAEERDALQKDKVKLTRQHKILEDFIEKEMIADAKADCCTIL
jgi:hypothetical protein